MIVWNDIENALHDWMLRSGLDENNIVWADQDGPVPEPPMIMLRVLGLRRIGQDWLDVAENPLVLADDTVESVSVGDDTLTLTAHAYATGDGPVHLTTTGALPEGLAVGVDYWIIRTSANMIKLAASFGEAMEGDALLLDGAGTGTHTIVGTAATRRAGTEITHTARGPRELTLSIQAFSGNSVGDEAGASILAKIIAAAALPSVRALLEAAGIGLAYLGPVQSISGAQLEPRATLEVRAFLASEVSEHTTYIERVELTNEITGAPPYTVPA